MERKIRNHFHGQELVKRYPDFSDTPPNYKQKNVRQN
jgi:hypothetical protein